MAIDSVKYYLSSTALHELQMLFLLSPTNLKVSILFSLDIWKLKL